MQTLLGFILAMSVTMVLIPLLMRWAVPLGILDMPDPRKTHVIPTPRVGGIAMVAGLIMALLLWDSSTRAMQSLAICIATLLVFGVWDDRKSLAAGPKFAGQALAALIAMFWGGISLGSVTFSERMPLPVWVAQPLTFLLLIGGTNAFNLADGLDGLAGGMGVLCLCGTGLLAYTVGNGAVGAAAVMMLGALIGFLRFNTHPARVFMGDGGSQVLGFCAAFLALQLTQDPTTPLSTALPLLLLGVPIIDTAMVMVERLVAGVSPFRADRRHIHHRLLGLGFAHWEAVSLLYLLQGGLLITAWFVRYDSDLLVALSFLLGASLIIVPLRVAELRAWRLRGVPAVALGAASSAAAVRAGHWATPRLPQSIGGWALAAALSAYALRVMLTGVAASRDLQLLAGGLAILLLAGLVLRWRRAEVAWTDKVALYCAAALAVFLNKHGLHALPGPWHFLLAPVAGFHLLDYLLYGVLALAMVVCIRCSGARPFEMTPLDILVLLLVATVPNLPDSVASARSLGLMIAEIVLLFYSLEALSQVAGRRWRWLNALGALFLLGIVLRPSL